MESAIKEVHVKYLKANEQDISWGLVTTTAGYQYIPPHSEYPSTNHPMRYRFSAQNGRVLNEYQLVYITKGHGRFVSASHKKVEINEGDMFLLFPGEWHNYRPDQETGWHEAWIGFTGKDIDDKVKNGFFQKNKPIFHIGILEDVFNLYKKAVEAATNQESGYQLVLSGIVNLLLAYSYSKDRQFSFRDRQEDDMVNKAKLYMQERFDSRITGEEIAKTIGVGYSKFRKAFKNYTGFSPSQFIMELRIAKAKELLTNTDMSCQQIGFVSGFETPSYFHVAFKNKTGMSPVSYRNFTQGQSLIKISDM